MQQTSKWQKHLPYLYAGTLRAHYYIYSLKTINFNFFLISCRVLMSSSYLDFPAHFACLPFVLTRRVLFVVCPGLPGLM